MEEQISILEDIDRRTRQTEKMEEARIRDKLDREYVNTCKMFGHSPDRLPDGLVVIEQATKYLQDRQKTVYYRCVVGHHKTVSGMMAHLISAPDEEWPEEPTWQYDKWNKCRWSYPHCMLWTRKEQEYDHETKWANDD